MQMVVAYIDRESFEPIREALVGLGVASLSAWEAVGSVPEPTGAASYRGAVIEQHLRPKTRFECVVGEDLVTPVIETVLKLATDRRFVFALPIGQAHPTELVEAVEPVAVTG